MDDNLRMTKQARSRSEPGARAEGARNRRPRSRRRPRKRRKPETPAKATPELVAAVDMAPDHDRARATEATPRPARPASRADGSDALGLDRAC